MERHGHVGLCDHLPESVMQPVCGGATGHRTGSQVHQTGASGYHELQLFHRAERVEQRQQRDAVDTILIVESPVIVEPQVERVEIGVGHLDVIHNQLFDADGQRWEQQGGFDALAVHHFQTRGPLPKLRPDRFQVGPVLSLDRRPALSQATGPPHDTESLIRPQMPIDLVAKHQPLTAAVSHLHPSGRLVGQRRSQVPEKGIFRFVVVIVRVEEPVAKLGHPARYGPRRGLSTPRGVPILGHTARLHLPNSATAQLRPTRPACRSCTTPGWPRPRCRRCDCSPPPHTWAWAHPPAVQRPSRSAATTVAAGRHDRWDGVIGEPGRERLRGCRA